ncbi:hypothetical protein VPFG_00258 [Vibrio phage nt-1]|uniref:Uncharacterized protein n=1 Tax=Vibrio phage nt-1 TaxID=115992 RepID=R9TJI4_9CAUD|nr:hypothetical protein VPFG_00258 [Vibrio phage nt-1]AGN30257.1 hypothetical protein VPFG_00258 [Vibrio phage nt-1]
MQPIDVRDRLPTQDGTYLCIRYGMSYMPEAIEFFIDCDDEGTWADEILCREGGGGVKPYNQLTNAEKYWRTNYGKVIYWFEMPENHMSASDFKDYMLAELCSRGIDPDAIDGKWDRVEAHGETTCTK